MPEKLDRDQLRIGMSGTARVFAENAGVIGLIGSILIWVRIRPVGKHYWTPVQ